MLLRFEAVNYRSILEPVELSMIAVDEDRSSVRSFELLGEKVVTTAGIYGANASGKSNVLEALAWLSTAVATSLRSWSREIPRDPFRLGDASHQPSTFEVEMMAEEVRYAYRVELTDDEVLSESLVSYPKRQPRTLFERDGLEISFRRGLANAAGTRDLLTPTTLALSAMMRFPEPEVRAFGTQLGGVVTRGLPLRRRWQDPVAGYASRYPTTNSIFRADADDRDGMRKSALAMLRFADLGISEVRLVPEEWSSDEDPARPRKLVLVHRVGQRDVHFDLEDESAGTRTWFHLIGPALSALRRGRIVLFDEIDASLHPQLSARLLELFGDPVSNPRGAQLIFTTHDTSLLNHLNRDEIWLTEKGTDGATRLTALAEFGGEKVRRSLNLEKAYLQGRFGAVPELDQVTLRRLLDLDPGLES